MDSSQKKNIALIGVAVLLLAGALVFGFRDSLFSGTQGAPALDEATTAAIAENTKPEDARAQPDPPNPPPKGSGKLPGRN